jgi:CheY-like chemotaxis protein
VKKVLIVDDEREIRESLEEFFQDEGFAVSTAANGAEALARLREAEAPCVVLLDLLMPVLDGNQVYQAMQQEPRLNQVPVIVMTSDPSRAPSGLLIMKKPMNLTRLLSTVRQHCPDCGSAPGI